MRSAAVLGSFCLALHQGATDTSPFHFCHICIAQLDMSFLPGLRALWHGGMSCALPVACARAGFRSHLLKEYVNEQKGGEIESSPLPALFSLMLGNMRRRRKETGKIVELFRG